MGVNWPTFGVGNLVGDVARLGRVKGPMTEDLVGNSTHSFRVASYVAMTGPQVFSIWEFLK